MFESPHSDHFPIGSDIYTKGMQKKTEERLMTFLSLIVLVVTLWAFFTDHVLILVSVTIAFIALAVFRAYKNGAFSDPEYIEYRRKIDRTHLRVFLPVAIILLVSGIAVDWQDGQLTDGPDAIWNNIILPLLGALAVWYFFIWPFILGLKSRQRDRTKPKD